VEDKMEDPLPSLLLTEVSRSLPPRLHLWLPLPSLYVHLSNFFIVLIHIQLDGSSIWTTVYTSFVNSPAATPVAADGAVHTVVVGGTGKLFFTPDHIVAAPRDQIVFQFQQKNQ
jgi:hypothetical protein